jgi:hypothetical protein
MKHPIYYLGLLLGRRFRSWYTHRTLSPEGLFNTIWGIQGALDYMDDYPNDDFGKYTAAPLNWRDRLK